MGDSAAVADNVEPVVAGFKVAVDLNLHIVELDLHAVEQGIVVGRAGSDLVKSALRMPTWFSGAVTRIIASAW